MWRQVVAQSPGENAPDAEVLRYDIGWKALNTMLKSGRSLSGHERNCAFLNTGGKGRFADISAAAGIDFADDGRVLALSDWDQDGDLDFWVANRTAPQTRFLRNNTDGSQYSLQFELRGNGTTSNRDAIGARLELHLQGEDGVRAQTVRSGGGYLGQSSRWLHFGFGKSLPKIKSVKVRWPDGSEELIMPTAAARRYTVAQGSGRADPSSIAARAVKFEEKKIQAPTTNGAARIVLITPPPIPAMKYKDAAGIEKSITGTPAKAKLITLWASWCLPCLAELKDWGVHAKQLSDGGVEVLALNIEATKDRAKTDAAWVKLGVPFQLGYGTETVASQFDVLQRALLSRQRPLPLPTSFLTDAAGNLRVIYKGPISAEQVIADTAVIGAPLEKVVESAVPYPGKWFGLPAGTSPNSIAVRFVEGGYLEEAEDFLRLLTESNSQHPTFKPGSAYLLLGAILSDQDRLEDAAAAFKSALEISPDDRQAHIELADVLAKSKRSKEAVPHLIAALEKRQDDPDLRFKLAMAYAESGDTAHAIPEFEKAITLRPTPAAHFNLGNVLLGQGKIAESLEQFESALTFAPDFLAAANNVAWLRAAHPDDALRDPARAVQLAEHLISLPDGKTASHLDTLAVAYAAAGRYEDAVNSAQDSIRLAKAAGNLATAKEVQSRLELYQKNQPYRDK